MFFALINHHFVIQECAKWASIYFLILDWNVSVFVLLNRWMSVEINCLFIFVKIAFTTHAAHKNISLLKKSSQQKLKCHATSMSNTLSRYHANNK